MHYYSCSRSLLVIRNLRNAAIPVVDGSQPEIKDAKFDTYKNTCSHAGHTSESALINSLDEPMNPDAKQGRKWVLWFFPMMLLGNWIGQATGRAYDNAYAPVLGHIFDTAVAGLFGSLLLGGLAIAIWFRVSPSQRQWLIWVVLPAYTVIGLVLGYLLGYIPDKLGSTLNGAYVGAVIGCIVGSMVGYAAGHAIVSQSLPSE